MRLSSSLGKCFFRRVLSAREEPGLSDPLALLHFFLDARTGRLLRLLALIARVQIVDGRVEIPPVPVLLRRLEELSERVFGQMSVRLELRPQQLNGLVVEVDKMLQLCFLVVLHRVLSHVLCRQEGRISLAASGPGADALLLEDSLLCLRRRRQRLLDLAAPLPPGRVLVDVRKFQLRLNSIVDRQAMVRSRHAPPGSGGRY